MNQTSGAKYQEFDLHAAGQNGQQSNSSFQEKSSNKCLTVCVLVAAVACVSLLVAVALAVGVGVGVSVSQSSNTAGEEEGLTVISLTQGELEGKYLSSGSDGGIHFRSTVNDTHFVLTISTTNGELIVTITHPLLLNMTLLGINRTDFLVMDDYPGRPRYDDYVVPDHMIEVMESIMRGDVEMSDSILQVLDNSTVNETRETALRDLALSSEAQLIIEAALALGEDLEIMGTDYPSALHFYSLALRLANTRDKLSDRDNNIIARAAANMLKDGDSESKKSLTHFNSDSPSPISFNRRDRRTATCNDGSRCQRCPFPNFDNDCFGLCGRQCSCWRFACGDCCVHQYCLTHDECCAQRGFFSWPCFAIAWRRIRCSSNYRC